MSKNSIKKHLDLNQLGKLITDVATGEVDKAETPLNPPKPKNPAAVALGRLGGLKGGKARAAKLSKEKRTEIANKGAKERWKDKKKNDN